MNSSLFIAVMEPPHPPSPSPSPPEYRRRRGKFIACRFSSTFFKSPPNDCGRPLLSSSPSPRYSEEKGLGDEEPRTGLGIARHHNDSIEARYDFVLPIGSWDQSINIAIATRIACPAHEVATNCIPIVVSLRVRLDRKYNVVTIQPSAVISSVIVHQ